MISSVLLFVFGITAVYTSFNTQNMTKANAQVLRHEIHEITVIKQVNSNEDLMKYEVLFLS